MSLIISVGVFDINERKTIVEAIQKQILKFQNFKTSNKKKTRREIQYLIKVFLSMFIE